MSKCGDCNKWMKSSLCPQEHRHKGRWYGPTMNQWACELFEQVRPINNPNLQMNIPPIIPEAHEMSRDTKVPYRPFLPIQAYVGEVEMIFPAGENPVIKSLDAEKIRKLSAGQIIEMMRGIFRQRKK